MAFDCSNLKADEAQQEERGFRMLESREAVFITQDQIDLLVVEALGSVRRRKNLNFHGGPAENPHRFLNAMGRGTYVTPHRHWAVPKPESFVVLAGEVGFVVFDGEGQVVRTARMGPETEPRVLGVDLPAGEWHALVVLSEAAVIFEVKPGPYDAATDKEFAPWAPREGEAGAEAYLAELESLFGGSGATG